MVHGELVLGAGVVMVGNAKASPSTSARWASPKSLQGRSTMSLYVQVSDVDAHFRRAKRAGATILAEPETSYGQRRYRALDLEGHEWAFGMSAP